jgi:hypothetical protein
MIFWQQICALWTDFLSTDQYPNITRFHFEHEVYSGNLLLTAKLIAKAALLSIIQRMSAIQHTIWKEVSRLSQAAPTALANPQKGNTRSHPSNHELYFFHHETHEQEEK